MSTSKDLKKEKQRPARHDSCNREVFGREDEIQLVAVADRESLASRVAKFKVTMIFTMSYEVLCG